jgi:phage baseplate assembly protein W
MLADFLGKGWSYPVGLDREGQIHVSRGEQSIQESIWIILATAPGERVMRPDFGCGIHHLVFALNDAETRGRVQKEVSEALIRWEPRIDVLDVDVEVKGHLEEQLLINVHYRVRSTNNFFNLVYPFYLNVAGQ